MLSVSVIGEHEEVFIAFQMELKRASHMPKLAQTSSPSKIIITSSFPPAPTPFVPVD